MGIGIISILLGLILAPIHRAQLRAAGAVCGNNLKQLQLAWQMYADDNRGRVPENRSHLDGELWRSTATSWCGPSSVLDDRDAENLKRGLPFRYQSNPKIYVCPTDDSVVTGTDLSRSRSYAMNSTFAGNSKNDNPEARFRTILSLNDQAYEWSRLFVFIDEHEDLIDDGHFLVWPHPDPFWPNVPADRHARAGVLTFADGHVENRLWRVAKRPRALVQPATGKQWEDLQWLQDRAHIAKPKP